VNYNDFPQQPLSFSHLMLQYMKVVKCPVTKEELKNMFPTRFPKRSFSFKDIITRCLETGVIKEVWTAEGRAWEITPKGIDMVYMIGDYLIKKRPQPQ